MRLPLIITLLTCLTASPALSNDDSGTSLMERGMQQFFEGLRQEMSPALDDLQGLMEQYGPPMRSFLREMGPAMGKVLEEVKDWSRYEAPEILPNGDIIMRRKPEPNTEPDLKELPEKEGLAPSGPTDI